MIRISTINVLGHIRLWSVSESTFEKAIDDLFENMLKRKKTGSASSPLLEASLTFKEGEIFHM